MNNLKKKLHVGTPEEVIEASNTFAEIEGINIKASQHSTYVNGDGVLMMVIIDFYSEASQLVVTKK